MRVIEASMEQHRNERAGETGDPRENPPTSGIVRHDSPMRISGKNRVPLGIDGNRTRDGPRERRKSSSCDVPISVRKLARVRASSNNCFRTELSKVVTDFTLLRQTLFKTILQRQQLTANYPNTTVTPPKRRGAAVAERLACSPPTKANPVRSPAGSLPDSRTWGIMPDWSAVTLIGSQDLAVRSREHLFTHSLNIVVLTAGEGGNEAWINAGMQGRGETGDLRENPPTSTIVWHDCNVRTSGGESNLDCLALDACDVVSISTTCDAQQGYVAVETDCWNIYQRNRFLESQAATTQTIVHEAILLSDGRLLGTCPFWSLFRGLTTRLPPRRTGFSRVGIVPYYAAVRRVFSGISSFPCPCIPALFHIHVASSTSALKTSMLRDAHISPLANAWLHHRGSKLDPRSDLRSIQKTVAPFEFKAGLEIKMKFFSNRQFRRFEISIRDQQPSSTHIKLDPGTELGSFDLGLRKMLVQPSITLRYQVVKPGDLEYFARTRELFGVFSRWGEGEGEGDEKEKEKRKKGADVPYCCVQHPSQVSSSYNVPTIVDKLTGQVKVVQSSKLSTLTNCRLGGRNGARKPYTSCTPSDAERGETNESQHSSRNATRWRRGAREVRQAYHGGMSLKTSAPTSYINHSDLGMQFPSSSVHTLNVRDGTSKLTGVYDWSHDVHCRKRKCIMLNDVAMQKRGYEDWACHRYSSRRTTSNTPRHELSGDGALGTYGGLALIALTFLDLNHRNYRQEGGEEWQSVKVIIWDDLRLRRTKADLLKTHVYRFQKSNEKVLEFLKSVRECAGALNESIKKTKIINVITENLSPEVRQCTVGQDTPITLNELRKWVVEVENTIYMVKLYEKENYSKRDCKKAPNANKDEQQAEEVALIGMRGNSYNNLFLKVEIKDEEVPALLDTASGIKLVSEKRRTATCSNLENTGDKLSVDQRRKLNETLAEFSDVITKRLGGCESMPYHIKVTDEERVRKKPYQCAPLEMKVLGETVSELLEKNIVRP
ncbi:hypothetical protein PR048_003791 [Dryococelus australis]|uniref:Uncharacterized protein n=1 Tax=Dryococelus australis TaxID=614101 RepID=A0ABQ9IPW6_9NEOP|nr:hypothetical protein PR048_003791 [Dryococelus australis]